MSNELKVDLTPVAELYAESLKEHGAQSIGVGWPGPDQHRLRFDKLTSVIEPTDKPITINDLGCGYGALYDYLVEKRIQIKHFHGYDISKDMLREAEKRLPKEGITLHASSGLRHTADYSFASGIFNVCFKENENVWLEYIEQTLTDMNEHSIRGFAFNLLSTYVDYRRDHLFYGDPLYFFDFCKRKFPRFVALLHDYPLYEWTITVRKA